MKGLYERSGRKSSKKREEIYTGAYEAGMIREMRRLMESGLDDVQASVEEFGRMAGLLMMRAFIEEEVERLAGKRYGRGEVRTGTRWGKESGYVVLGGQKVGVKRQRVRGVKGGEELPLETYASFQRENPMLDRILGRIVLGVSQRNYGRSIDEFAEGYGVSRTSVSRKGRKALTKKLKELSERQFDNVDIVVILADGLKTGDSMMVAAMGIDSGGRKHILGLAAGTTENSAVCRELFVDAIDRGLSAEKAYLFVTDGGTGLRKAVREVFGGDAEVQRCKVHKERNVTDNLAKRYKEGFKRRYNLALGMTEYEDARRELEKTAAYLETISGSAAKSMREGMDELLTLHRLGIKGALRRTLSTTNLIESVYSKCRSLTHNVKRWRNEDQGLKWTGAMLLECEKKFRRVKGYRDLEKLKEILEKARQKVIKTA